LFLIGQFRAVRDTESSTASFFFSLSFSFALSFFSLVFDFLKKLLSFQTTIGPPPLASVFRISHSGSLPRRPNSKTSKLSF